MKFPFAPEKQRVYVSSEHTLPKGKHLLEKLVGQIYWLGNPWLIHYISVCQLSLFSIQVWLLEKSLWNPTRMSNENGPFQWIFQRPDALQKEMESSEQKVTTLKTEFYPPFPVLKKMLSFSPLSLLSILQSSLDHDRTGKVKCHSWMEDNRLCEHKLTDLINSISNKRFGRGGAAKPLPETPKSCHQSG